MASDRANHRAGPRSQDFPQPGHFDVRDGRAIAVSSHDHAYTSAMSLSVVLRKNILSNETFARKAVQIGLNQVVSKHYQAYNEVDCFVALRIRFHVGKVDFIGGIR